MHICRIETDEQRIKALNILKTAFKDPSLQERAVSSLEEKKDEQILYGAIDEGSLEAVICLNREKSAILLCQGSQQGMEELIDHVSAMAEQDNIARLSAYVSNEQIPLFETAGFTIERKEETGAHIEYLCGQRWLGKTVHVTVDRPYGSFHPHLPDVLMPMNCGYINESLGEGELIDAYVYGIHEPLEQAAGYVAAMIYRREDERLRAVVIPGGMTADRNAVIAMIGFEEQYYETRLLFADDIRRA